MSEFIPLTSRSFRDEFPATYQRFFSSHDLVATGRFSVPLNPVITGWPLTHSIVAREKTSLSCLVGISRSPADSPGSGILSFGTTELFTFESGGFESLPLEDLIDHSEELFWYLEILLRDVLARENITINVLSEAPRGYSLAFSGTFAGVLAHAIDYMRFPVNGPSSHGVISDERMRISETARAIESIVKAPEIEGQVSFQTLYAEAAPSVFVFKPGRERQLCKLAGVENTLKQSLEYGVIYSGIAMKTSTFDLRGGSTEAKNGAAWCTNKLGLKMSSRHYTDSMRQVILLENAHLLSRLDEVMDTNDGSIDSFLLYANELAHSFEKLDGKSDFLGLLWKKLMNQGILDQNDITILPLYTTNKGGSFVWYGKRGVAKKNLYKALSEMRARYPELNVVFDGQTPLRTFRAEVTIEQDTKAGYDHALRKMSRYLIEKDGQKKSTEAYNTEALSQWGILIDRIARKMFIDGEKVSSKEIFSQQTTIDLLERFIEKWSDSIHVSELPKSSYCESKSEMMSKIIHPLVRTLRSRLGKDVRINCEGSTTDFTIEFLEMDIEMQCLEKA